MRRGNAVSAIGKGLKILLLEHFQKSKQCGVLFRGESLSELFIGGFALFDEMFPIFISFGGEPDQDGSTGMPRFSRRPNLRGPWP